MVHLSFQSKSYLLAAFLLGAAANLAVTADPVHKVKKGETLDEIAEAYGTSRDQLIAINGLDQPNKIFVGQELRVVLSTVRPPQQEYLEVKIPKKATLSALSREYGIPLEALAEINGLKESFDIFEGQTIRIPIEVASTGVASSPTPNPDQKAAQATGTITVGKGQSLYHIAKEHGLAVDTLAQLNDLKPPFKNILAGQTLKVPVTETQIQSPASTTKPHSSVVVAKGDTLAKLASNNAVTLKQLAEWNQLAAPYKIYPGQVLWLIPGKVSKAPSPSRPDLIVTVQKNEALSEIATRHGLSWQELARYNKITDPNQIYAGQKLKIPRTGNWAPPYSLPDKLEGSLKRVAIKKGQWKHIVIHHSATDVGSARAFDNTHKQKGMENGLAYHFVIGNGRGMNDGEIAIGSRWKKQIAGGHLNRRSPISNEVSIGICLVGNFENGRPSQRQLDSLEELTRYLMHVCKLNPNAVGTHSGVHPNWTKCPGSKFPINSFLTSLKSKRKAEALGARQ